MAVNQTIRIVVVDDDAMVRTGLRMILGGESDIAIVGEAADGVAGLTLIDDCHPDVVLLDVRMPVLDGLAVTERLQAMPTRPAIIMLTTFNTDDYVLRALKAGARGFLLKDTSPVQMIDAIRRAHRGEPVLSPQVAQQVIAVATAGTKTDANARQLLATLSEREREVAHLLATGLSNQEIAAQLYLSLASVKANLTRIFYKLGVDNRVAAAIKIRDGGEVSD